MNNRRKQWFSAGALMLVMVALIALAPGSGALNAQSATPTAGVDEVGYTGPLDKDLFVYNWGGYIDETLLKEYEDKYGVKITYDNFASNEELFAKLQAGAQYDVIFPSDYMVSRVIKLGLVAKIDKKNTPNIANIGQEFIDSWYDPGAEYCAPYMWSVTGIAYHKSLEKVPDSWAVFFDPEQAKYYADNGGINLLDDPREVIGAALQYLGFSYNSTNADEIGKARDLVIAALPNIRYLNSADYQDTLLIPKEVVLSHSWAGSAAYAALQTATADNPKGDWKFVLPKEGGVRVQDAMCVTANSPRKATAEHFINFLLRADSAARSTDATGYISANKASWELINPLLKEFIPPAETLAKMEWILPVDEAAMQTYDQTWTEIRSAQ